MSDERPKVAVTVLVFKEGKVLLGRRVDDKPGSGMYGNPGGHLEFHESIMDCVKREVVEETGIEVENIRFLCAVNVRQFAPVHYMVLCMGADWKSGEPQTLEPDRCEGWQWYDLNHLPSPLTPATAGGIKTTLEGGQSFEATTEGLKRV